MNLALTWGLLTVWGVCDGREEINGEGCTKVLRSFPKVNMPDPFVPLSNCVPADRQEFHFEIFENVAERGNGPLGHGLCIDGFVYS